MISRPFSFGRRSLGAGQPIFITAEAGINHNGNLKLAHRMIDVAVQCRVDAIKFQTFSTERLVSRYAQKAAYQKANTQGGSDQFRWLKPLELDEEAHRELKSHAEKKGLVFFSTPFDAGCVALLERIRVPVYKIASGNVTDTPLLSAVGKTKKPVIISTGMSTLKEIREAVALLKKSGSRQILLLHCTSNYPTRVENSHVRVMQTLSDVFHLPVGFSDHNTTNFSSFAAAAMGACLIERHFTLDKKLPGADQNASLTPEMLAALVDGIRQIEKALGSPKKYILPSEWEVKRALQKSVVASRDISSGETFTDETLTVKRPGTGLAPKDIGRLIGRKAKHDIEADRLITFDMVA